MGNVVKALKGREGEGGRGTGSVAVARPVKQRSDFAVSIHVGAGDGLFVNDRNRAPPLFERS